MLDNNHNCLRNNSLALSDAKNLISSFEDQRIESQDLVFFPATHGYDVSPRKAYVELKNERYDL